MTTHLKQQKLFKQTCTELSGHWRLF